MSLDCDRPGPQLKRNPLGGTAPLAASPRAHAADFHSRNVETPTAHGGYASPADLRDSSRPPHILCRNPATGDLIAQVRVPDAREHRLHSRPLGDPALEPSSAAEL